LAETFPFGAKTSVFKVAGKMFALSQLAEHPLRVSLKCEPQLAEPAGQALSELIEDRRGVLEERRGG
jgi:predicted DNA-binding protein (MmcQ/YjbR family)